MSKAITNGNEFRNIRGIETPSFFYGTAWKEDQTEELVLAALKAGFRAIDTANQRRHYHEAGVGAALKLAFAEGLLTRDELFLQSKFTFIGGQDHRLPYDPEASPTKQVHQSFASSLEHLGVDFLDSYVLHGPSTQDGLTDLDFETWTAMEAIHAEGRTRLLGISNVSLLQLQMLCSNAKTQPAFVQNRCYARTAWDSDVRLFCKQHDITYQGFSLLTANRTELASKEVNELVKSKERSLAQIVFRFALQLGMIPLTGTTNPEHMRHDLKIYDFELSENELQVIEKCGI